METLDSATFVRKNVTELQSRLPNLHVTAKQPILLLTFVIYWTGR